MGSILESFLIGFVGFIVIYIIWMFFQKQKYCPKCKAELPPIRLPANNDQMLWGGWTCQKCGAKIDKKGNLIKKKKRQPKK